ncbi:type II secretion system GspH family protein [Patescibacteria group bacterium]|nr:type II secretion system GspH family protein [Patescibacteria group bacterium]MCL5114863.1 type II secretion system GspH family protein [Patescibacteria group bacterium]
MKEGEGFTLIELLVVIAILAVLATAVVLVLNPAELIKQGRDSTRISDLAALNSAIALFVADVRNPTWPAANCYPNITNTIASSTPTCNSGTYQTGSTSTAVDGSGWVKINFTQISSGSPLSKLPVDPQAGNKVCRDLNGTANAATCEYIFTTTSTVGVYEIDAAMESAKYGKGGSADVVSTDNGSSAGWYEVGSGLNLMSGN